MFFDPALSMSEKVDRAILYGNLMLRRLQRNQSVLPDACGIFLGRIENDLYYRGGTDEQIVIVMDRELYAKSCWRRQGAKMRL